jgi:hypothetical protein
MIEADDELKKSGSEYSYTSTGSDGVSLDMEKYHPTPSKLPPQGESTVV